MVGKFSFLVGLGTGYVLGARSGRDQYDKIAAKAQGLVKKTTGEAAGATSEVGR